MNSSLDQLAADINGRIEALGRGLTTARERAKQMRISISQQMVQARDRVAAGEAGEDMTWRDWHTANILRSTGKPLTIRAVNRFLRIGNAEDAEAELDKLNAESNESRSIETVNLAYGLDQSDIVSLARSDWLAGMVAAWRLGTPGDQAAFRAHIGA